MHWQYHWYTNDHHDGWYNQNGWQAAGSEDEGYRGRKTKVCLLVQRKSEGPEIHQNFMISTYIYIYVYMYTYVYIWLYASYIHIYIYIYLFETTSSDSALLGTSLTSVTSGPFFSAVLSWLSRSWVKLPQEIDHEIHQVQQPSIH